MKQVLSPTPQHAEAIVAAGDGPVQPRFWYVESDYGSWFVDCAKGKTLARQHGREEWGYHHVAIVREATTTEVETYCRQKGRTRADLIRDARMTS